MRKILPLSLFTLFALLFAACSTSASGEPPPNPTATLEDALPATATQSPTDTVGVPSATPTTEAPTATLPPTPAEDTATPLPTETAPPTSGSTRISEVDQMEQVYVPAGEFIMGAADKEAKITIEGGRAYPEIPQHTVYLDSYWIDKYEVTTSQYALCVAAGVCREPWDVGTHTRAKYYGEPEFADYPVVWVSWYLARDYCEWAGRRLPTEAEWEKAARGTDGQMYPWGNDPISGERANFCDVNCTRTIANPIYDDGYMDTAPVGSYPAGASPYGAMDMSGNVWEWVSTLIRPYPYDATDGREDMDSTEERAWRGGPWSNGIWWMRSSVRYRSVPTYWWYNLGFRCASSE